MTSRGKEVEEELAAARLKVVEEEQRQAGACAQRRADLGSLLRTHNLFACSLQPHQSLRTGWCDICNHKNSQHTPGGHCLGCLTEITAIQVLDVDP